MGLTVELTELAKACRWCGKVHTIVVPTEAYYKWQSGVHIQKALHMLDADTRELLISGTCAECWQKMFPEED